MGGSNKRQAKIDLQIYGDERIINRCEKSLENLIVLFNTVLLQKLILMFDAAYKESLKKVLKLQGLFK
jgi:hypothetical protein